MKRLQSPRSITSAAELLKHFLSFSGCDQAVKAFLYKLRPAAGTVFVTFNLRIQSLVSKADLRPAVQLPDLKNDLCSRPFTLVLRKAQLAVVHQPYHFFIRDKLQHLLIGKMDALKTIIKFIILFC